MTGRRHARPGLWDGLLTAEAADLWEPWMREVDQLLDDDELLDSVYEAQGKRRPQSRRRGRRQTPAGVVLRMLLLKHIRNWSYETLEREVRANLAWLPYLTRKARPKRRPDRDPTHRRPGL